MPNFARAEVTEGSAENLAEYRAFLKKLSVGQVVNLPLEQGETTRKVMRGLNAAAQQSGMRLSRIPSDERSVRFRVAAPEKRKVNISPAAARARAEKAKATRAGKRQATSAPAARRNRAAK